MLRVFIGVDERQPIAFSVLAYSIARHCSVPVQITPLLLKQLPITRRGLTEFTFSRFLVPYLCAYEGAAIFMDGDIVVTGDIAELFAQADPECDVQVMQYQAKFEWSSVMLFNNARCQVLTPDYVQTSHNPLTLSWAQNIGHFRREWNFCVGYETSEGFSRAAKLYHYTRGLPIWKETRGNPEDAIWMKEAKIAGSTCTHAELMGDSVHVKAS
jgi:lipopolysaccharide biosynthesis glycosyltransferase